MTAQDIKIELLSFKKLIEGANYYAPDFVTDVYDLIARIPDHPEPILSEGKPSRLEIAAMAMQGLLSQHVKDSKQAKDGGFADEDYDFIPVYKAPFMSKFEDDDVSELIKDSYTIADSLIAYDKEGGK